MSGPALQLNADVETRWADASSSIRASTQEVPAATRLKQLYGDKVKARLHGSEGFTNLNRVPRLEKIVINCGLGEASDDAKSLAATLQDLSTIAGQKAVVTRSKKAIAGFSIRKDVPVGVCVTLRGEAMFAFLDRLINLALPRIRDFQGLKSSSFDGRGNFHLGLQEQLMFPEIDYDQVQKVRGMDVSFVTTAQNNDEGLQLLTALGMPFRGVSK
jgi:large subunit ribosomal protein L5